MAIKAQLVRTLSKGFQPLNVDDFDRIKPGEIIEVSWTKPRNPKFHRKVMALFKFVHDQLPDSDAIEYEGNVVTPLRDFDATRKWLTVKAGFYNVYGLPNGSYRIEAKSLSFSNMSDVEFEKVFSALIDVALELVPQIKSKQEIQWAVEEVIRFT